MPVLLKRQEDDPTNVVTTNQVACYRERNYFENFGAFMREWVAFSEDWRCELKHPLSKLNEAFNVFVLAAVNYAGYLQREDDLQQLTKLRRVRRVVELLGECRAPLSQIENNAAFYCDEMDRCFVKIDRLLLKMEGEFGLLLTKRPSLPAPP
jgi:hypothetical protein